MRSALPRYTLFRTQTSRVKKATQKAPAIEAVTMKFSGETSHEVSETMRPKAKQLKKMARKSQSQPCSSRFVLLGPVPRGPGGAWACHAAAGPPRRSLEQSGELGVLPQEGLDQGAQYRHWPRPTRTRATGR